MFTFSAATIGVAPARGAPTIAKPVGEAGEPRDENLGRRAAHDCRMAVIPPSHVQQRQRWLQQQRSLKYPRRVFRQAIQVGYAVRHRNRITYPFENIAGSNVVLGLPHSSLQLAGFHRMK